MLNLFLPPILRHFKEQHADAKLLITTGHTCGILENIRARELDVGIVSLPTDAHGLLLTPLYREEIVIAVKTRHPLSSRRILRVNELSGLPLIVFSKGSSTRAVLDQFFQQIGVTPAICLEVENDEAAERATAAGVGFCFLPRTRAIQDGIHFLRVHNHPIYRDVALVCSPPPTDLVSEFLSICREHASEMTAKASVT
jgi:DNA-binding transcriptional LysR family regulator